ncbi:glycerol-3-phosphate 1-O-acyltransferase PlsB [Flocculibacter collagenilyticus]|uniref:glycerol-3-phosphate 1-O-acyltransferase PlsB n=1 Tax=Flocculibacter collagenilyticus TaxID=2744479 RepID=UPI0018F299C5|nr:glycerol-3-phosphate 1-O-acyltransferase PlsB [Flocculibacter collagenilyticus]
MSVITTFLNSVLKYPVRWLIRSKIIPADPTQELDLDAGLPIFYILQTQSSSDVIALEKACQKIGLPNPVKPAELNGSVLQRTLYLARPQPVFGDNRKPTDALQQGEALIQALRKNPSQDALLVPVTIVWGRAPGKEQASVQQIIDDVEAPSWFRKMFTVLFSGRDNLIRFSKPVSLRTLVDQHGHNERTAHKLLRVARFHFYRQKLAVTGPRLTRRAELFNSLLAAPSLKKAIEDEAKNKKITIAQARQNAVKLLDEVAADYRDSYIRIGDRFLTWLWNKLYRGIIVNNAEKVTELAQSGHEIVYVPCHRSHMDYMLLTYVIYQQGLVAPHIAAGINLNFWPAGPIFRKSGAFFIRRSFRGNKLYSAVFREYLSQLFSKGYSVKYYTEGGRSRTGLLLQPKTGMLAMTLQSMLRGIERPITLVPVYLGYEHVMEVSTYLKELKGKTKKNESVFGVFKAIKNLRNYGHGYVNFGEPISVNQFLNEQAPDWKQDIDPLEPQKPSWLTPSINVLANQIMTRINNAAALNSVNLAALILLCADKHALTRKELTAQLQLYIQMQKQVPYSSQISVPEESASELIDHLIEMQKVQQTSDQLGDIISLDEKEQILMNYYRNNIIHLFAIPGLLASIVVAHQQIDEDKAVKLVLSLFPLFKKDWFLNDQCPEEYTKNMLNFLVESGLCTRENTLIKAAARQSNQFFNLQLLANSVELILQRYAIVFTTITEQQPLSRSALESQSHTLAKRLSSLHGINSPEFYDKKVLSTLTSALKEQALITVNEQGDLVPTTELINIKNDVVSLLRNEVIQSLQH